MIYTAMPDACAHPEYASISRTQDLGYSTQVGQPCFCTLFNGPAWQDQQGHDYCRPGLESLHAESQRTRYTVDFHKAPFTGLGLTFASHPETGEVWL